ncbi:MAG: 4Fe-4S cluster-binding domain-containing protein, partial [Candidatus Altiarchaeales archaeon]|nr:4Fe-4S cluster-binding domain-containing protein [Candidatus Altiarchaeales archaeon]
MSWVKGLQRTSLIDYPPYVVATVFLGGCNMRCPFCHNPDLIDPEEGGGVSGE